METAGTWKNRVFAAGKGVLLSWIVTGILLALLSLALWKLDLDEGKVTIGIQAVYMLSAFAGGMMTGKKVQSRKFLWGLLVGILYFLILLVLSCINGSLSASQSMIVLCICAGSGTVGGMLA